MTTLKKTIDSNEPQAQAVSGAPEARLQAQVDAEISRRSTDANWDELMSDYVAIEKRAQVMRSEAAWNGARALRDWAVAAFRKGKAKASSAAPTSLERHGQPT